MSAAAEYPYFDAPPLALAHRGGAEYAPNRGIENTVRAFRNAVDLGYRYLETDVHATRDGHVVAFHDDRLDRLTEHRGRIADLTWPEVRRARINGTEPIPQLGELFEAFPATRVNIDAKADGAVEPLWRLIQDHEAQDRVCVGSFSDRRLWAFRRLAGHRVATAAGPLGVAAMRLGCAWLGRLVRTPAQVLQIPLTHTIAGRTTLLLTARLVDTAHRHGKQVHVWTIDQPAEMHRLLDLGVDGIVSDRIDTLRHVLMSRGAWRGAVS